MCFWKKKGVGGKRKGEEWKGKGGIGRGRKGRERKGGGGLVCRKDTIPRFSGCVVDFFLAIEIYAYLSQNV